MAVRNGNAYLETVSYSLSHGSTPSTCQMKFSEKAAIVTDQDFAIFVGGSQWQGRTVDVRDITNESGGLVTQVRAVDFRDDLAGQVIYGQFNMIDKDDGTVYQINDLATGGAGTGGWQGQVVVEGHIYPRDLIVIMVQNAGFNYLFSAAVEAILANAGLPWPQTIYNIFDLDWNTGVKVHAALQEICQRLGIQFTILMTTGDNDPTLRFTVIGEPDYPNILWEGMFAAEHEIGVGVNLEVDTGVNIIGDRELDEFSGDGAKSLVAGWNTAWNTVFWDRALLAQMLDQSGLDELTNTVSDWANVFGSQYNDAGFIEPRHFFNDFTIKDYLNTAPFRVYRISDMANYLTPDELSGNKHVRLPKIITPLVSDPGVQYNVLAANVKRKTKDTHNALKVSSIRTPQQSGIRLYESSGHVVFAAPRFGFIDDYKSKVNANAQVNGQPLPWPTVAVAAFTPSNPARAPFVDVAQGHLQASDLIVDTPTIECVFLGDVYKQFFGVSIRIGTKHVPHLRVAKVVDGSNGTDPDNYPEYVNDGEKSADNTANDVATAYLWRPRVVTSGKDKFIGFAGHVPSGEISRVSVEVNEGEGVAETVDYSNDEPSRDYDPQIEQRRRVAQELLKVKENRLRTDEQRRLLHEQRTEAAGKPRVDNNDVDDDHLNESSLDPNAQWSIVNNQDGTPRAYGQPVVGIPNPTSRQLAADSLSTLKDGDPNIMGVCHRVTTSTTKIPMQNSGIATALVTGPVVKGDSLGYDKTNMALKKVSGGTVTAMEDQPSSTPMLAAVRLGAGGSSSVFCVAASTDNMASIVLLAGGVLDGVTLSDGDQVLFKDQITQTQNGVYKYKASDNSLSSLGSPPLVIVTAGSFTVTNTDGFRNAKKLFFQAQVSPPIYVPLDEFNAVADVVAIAGSVITNGGTAVPGSGSIGVALSGTGFVVDGFALNTPGQTVLLQTQGTSLGTSNQNGLWLIQQGSWVFLGQPKVVAVRNGSSANAKTNFILTAVNTYSQMASGSSVPVVARVSPDGNSFGGIAISNPPSGNLAIDAQSATDYAANGSLVLIATGAAAGVWIVNSSGAWTKSSPFQPAQASVSGASPQSYYDTLWFLLSGAYIAFVGVWG